MEQLRQQMQLQLEVMIATGKLYKSSVTGRKVWDTYLKSFNIDDDPIFRDPESSYHNCNHCNNFMRRYGNIVTLDEEMNIITLFDFIPNEDKYVPVVIALSTLLKSNPIENVFFETFDSLKSLPYEAFKREKDAYRLGTPNNVKRYTKEEADKFPGVVEPNEIRTFQHMSLIMPKQFVKKTDKSIEAIQSGYRDAKNVFHRLMEEIPADTLVLVIDLIKQGSLLDGDTHLNAVEEILPFKRKYNSVARDKKDNWCWYNSYGMQYAKFKNTLIGQLCTELAEGMELNKACENWNKRVDPINYKKATAPITKRQIEEAKIFVEANGYESSFKRRLATIEDIQASEILHMNADGGNKTSEVHLFDSVTPTKSTQHKRSEFDGVEEVTIEKFMSDILPGCTSVEAFLKNNHEGHMVTLTTAKSKDSKQIFKWNNPFSWTFNGNIAGKSMIKNAVHKAGGIIDGVLNFRLAWNDIDGRDNSDLDAWAKEPGNVKIGYSTDFRKDRNEMYRSPCSGQLDVDNTQPGGKLAVENITWNNLESMRNGKYKLWVHQYRFENSQGFKAEIEFDGQIYDYEYSQPVRGSVEVAEITIKDGRMSIKHLLNTDSDRVKNIYNLETNHFHKVNLLCLSPNHWGSNNIGNKYYFFMLEGAQANKSIRSFHNENLKGDLIVHRKVMEVLANTTMVESKSNELSGLGFNSTVRDELILRLKGSHKRVIKVKF